MKILSSLLLAYRQARGGVSCKGLIWIEAKNRTTGAIEAMGLWQGDDHRTFTIGGQTRTYYGAGNLLDLGETVAQVGVQVRTRTVTMSALTPEVIQATRGFDVRLARTQIHRAEFDTQTGNLIDEPTKVFKGFVDKTNLPTSAMSEEGVSESTAVLTLASAARSLTRGLALKFSDASQRLRNAADRLFQFTVAGTVTVWWGEKRVDSPGTSANAAQKVASGFFGKRVIRG